MLLLLSCTPEPVIAEATTDPYARHVEAGLLKAPDFTARIEKPWVVFGDGPKGPLDKRVEGTVRWATVLLKKDYFPQDPPEPVDIWLFQDAKSYESHVTAWFDEAPDTPYGFANEDGLFMDISTGGGTLVHEMVHPLMEVNFPACPPWFNEGLASLYEAVTEHDGHLQGLLNWRLQGLQHHIQVGDLPSFEVLMAQDADAFYNRDPADNYAQSRYLLYYLQEQDKLRPYYKAFHDNVEQDPTGYKTLKRVLEREDMAVFQTEWEAWVLTLKR